MAQAVVEVVAAVIERADGSYLLAQRPAGKAFAGYWEFPGGKVEPGEPVTDALMRELHEELGIDVETAFPWITRTHSYPHANVRLHFHRVTRWRGEPHPREGQTLSWQRCDRPTVSPLLPANGPILKALRLPTKLGITCAWESGVETALRRMRAAIQGGMRLIQIRERNLDSVARRNFAAQVIQEVHEVGGIVVINGDQKLARALGAGLHLPSRELMAAKARPDFEWCSAACHDAAELERASELELDFVLLGPVQMTASHVGAPALGWYKFAELTRNCTLPVFALGGMRQSNLDLARQWGAHGVAMMRGAWEEN